MARDLQVVVLKGAVAIVHLAVGGVGFAPLRHETDVGALNLVL